MAGEGAAADMRTKLTLGGGMSFLALGLLFTSLLAMFGSLLWGFIPYWAPFMFTNLLALYTGVWGVLVAVLAPIATAILFQDPNSVLDAPANVGQTLLFLALMRVLRVDIGLRTVDDCIKYLFITMVSAATGGAVAWALATAFGHAPTEGGLHFTGLWMFENTTPAILPGIWLHRVVSATSQPFTESENTHPKSWMRRTLEYTIPWMATLVIISTLLGVMLVSRHTGATGFWDEFLKNATTTPALRIIALVLSISILFSVGIAVQQARQSWTLVEAVRRHMPNRRLSELLTGGAAIPTEQRLVTVVFTDLRGFTETSAQFEPGDLVTWLNTYFTHMGAVIERHGGAIDKFIGDGIMIVFGLQSPDAQARQALLCALDMLVEIEAWQKASVARGLPAVGMGVGIHSGIVTAGEIGSPQRKQYTVIGSVVNTSARLESASKGVPDGALPLVLSHEAAKHCGLLVHPERDKILLAITVALKGVVDVDSAWSVRADGVGELRAAMSGAIEAIKLR